MTFFLTDTNGQKSFTLTAAVLALGTVLIKVLCAGVVIGKFTFGAAPDAGTIAALLTPTLGAYVIRRGQGQDAP